MIEKAIEHVGKTHEKIAEKEDDRELNEEVLKKAEHAKAHQDKKDQVEEVAKESKAAAKKVEKKAAKFEKATDKEHSAKDSEKTAEKVGAKVEKKLDKAAEKAEKSPAAPALPAVAKNAKLAAAVAQGLAKADSAKAAGKQAAKDVKEAGKAAAKALKPEKEGDDGAPTSGHKFTASEVKDVAAMAAKHSAEEVVSILRGEDAKNEMKGRKLNETLEKATHVPPPKHDPATTVKAAIQKAVIISMSPGKDTEFESSWGSSSSSQGNSAFRAAMSAGSKGR